MWPRFADCGSNELRYTWPSKAVDRAHSTTMTLFIIQNHQGEFLDKQLNWAPPGDIGNLFHTPHRDVALNQLIELNARDVQLRAGVVTCSADEKGRPQPDVTSTLSAV
jgi:hypothetical protein